MFIFVQIQKVKSWFWSIFKTFTSARKFTFGLKGYNAINTAINDASNDEFLAVLIVNKYLG